MLSVRMVETGVLLLSLLFLSIDASSASSSEKVSLQLAWKHQFQFAGYYAALHKGYYQQVGLDVVIVEGGEGKFAREEVLSGLANFGVAGAELILHRHDGDPFVVLAPIFQHSPSILLYRRDSGIKNLQDLIGKRVMLLPENKDADILAAFLDEGISLESIRRLDQTYDLNDLIEGRTDAVSAYVTNEPWHLLQEGIEPGVVTPQTYGVDFYSDCLFTTENEIEKHPKRVQAFLNASLLGWGYAMDNPREIIELLATEYGVEKNRDHLLYEAESIQKIILPNLVEIGHTNPGRWRHIAKTYQKLGMIDGDFSLEGFLYDPDPDYDYTWLKRTFFAAMAIILLLGIGAAVLFFFNRKLAKEVVERKQAEKALRESKDQIGSIFRSAPVGIGSVVDRVLKNVNSRLCEITGYDEDELIGRSARLLYPGDEEFEFVGREKYAQIAACGSGTVETRWKRKDGTIIDVLLSSATFGLQDQSKGVTFTAMDITERKISEKKLEQRAQIISQVHDSIVTTDPNFRIIDFNAGAEKLYGYAKDEVVGKTVSVLFPEDRREFFEDTVMGQLANKDEYSLEIRMRKKTGELIDTHLSLSRLRNSAGEPEGTVCFAIDITDRKNAEKALQASNRRLLTILDSIDATIYVADIETYEILFMNKNMIQHFGRDMTGELCWDVFRGEHGPCPQCTNDKLVDETGKPSGVCVWQDRNPITGKWYINYDRAIEWIDGCVVRIQIATDISDLKKMEDQLRQSQKMEAIGILAGGIAHDFNNILTSIIGFSELAVEKAEKGSPLEDSLLEIHSAGIRAGELVKQILTFARKDDTSPKPIRVRKQAEEALRFLRSTIPASVEIERRLESDAWVMGDASQLQQIFLNLCTNAAQSMEKEGGTLTVCLRDVWLGENSDMPHLGGAGRFVEIRVGDTGTGIPEKYLGSVFEPYFTTKPRGKGTGLGLAVVHGIVKNAGGDIVVQSELGKGTIFTAYLPATNHCKKREEPVRLDVPTGMERILFVDDEPSIAKMSAIILQGLGYAATSFTDSQEALEVFRSDPDAFDAVVTDMTMPQMNGDKLALEILNIRPDIPIILCTGFSNQITSEKAAGIGIRAFAVKPLERRELANVVRKALDEAKG